MKQKFLYSVLLLSMFVCNSAYAQTVEVRSLSDFSTANPPKSISIQLLEPLEIKKDNFIEAGGTIQGDLVDVVSPKRLKRDADFSFEPKTYTGLNGKTRKIKAQVKASYTEPVEAKQVAKKTVVAASNLVVAGLGLGVAAVEGAVKNEEGNRFKSSMSSAYEASPFSYARKGEDINIKAGQVFFLKFPSSGKIEKEIEKVNNESATGSKEIVKGQNYSIEIEKE